MALSSNPQRHHVGKEDHSAVVNYFVSVKGRGGKGFTALFVLCVDYIYFPCLIMEHELLSETHGHIIDKTNVISCVDI